MCPSLESTSVANRLLHQHCLNFKQHSMKNDFSLSVEEDRTAKDSFRT